jgi:hypothetical protein
MPTQPLSTLLLHLACCCLASLLGASALANPTSHGLNQLEYQLYKQTYPQQSHTLRLNRLETSIWGKPHLPNAPPSSRLEALHNQMRQNTSSDKPLLRTLAYLEQRMGCVPLPTASLQQRISQLEALVFGQDQETAQQTTELPSRFSPVSLNTARLAPTPMLSLEQRLERLSQQLPLRVRTLQVVTPRQ